MKKVKFNSHCFQTFKEYHLECMKDPEYVKAWEEADVEYQIFEQLVRLRMKKKISQRTLAKKLHTSQAAVHRLESGQGNPTLGLLKRIGKVSEKTLHISYR